MTRRVVGVTPPRATADRAEEGAAATPPNPAGRTTTHSDRRLPRPAPRCREASASLPELADVAEVAAWLKTTPKAIYAMVERAQLPGAVRIGRRLLFERTALVHWLSERRVPSPLEQRP